MKELVRKRLVTAHSNLFVFNKAVKIWVKKMNDHKNFEERTDHIDVHLKFPLATKTDAAKV